MQNSDEWSQYYDHETNNTRPETALSGLSDDTNMASNPRGGSPRPGGSGEFSPRGSDGKPIKRRSRASRKAPTTLLNASPTDFRALVQQFTGCQSAASSSHRAYKGPINLNFAMNQEQQGIDIDDLSSSSTSKIWMPTNQEMPCQKQDGYYKVQGFSGPSCNNVVSNANHAAYVSSSSVTNPRNNTFNDFDMDDATLPGNGNDDFWG